MSATLTAFLAGERQLPMPFTLNLNEQTFQCEQILRLLPGKRLVVRACNQAGQICVIKLFVKAHKGQREFERELRGHARAKHAGLAVAEIVAGSDKNEAYCVIAFEFIRNSQVFSPDIENKAQLTQLMDLMATMHQQGLYQDDIHFDNLLLAEQQFYLIDLGTLLAPVPDQPLDRQTSLANLARLIAQLPLAQQQAVLACVERYFEQRGWAYDLKQETVLQQLLDRAWHKRKRDYLKKCFRSCTMTVYGKSMYRQFAFRRDFWEQWAPEDVADIDSLFEQAQLLKAGNTATVILTEMGGRRVVIKRYNIKSVWHWLKRCWRPSRAAISWRNGNLLEFVGIRTAKPLGFVERRWGPLRTTAYLISEYEPADELLSVYQQRLPTNAESDQIVAIFHDLRQARISHGDMKAQNLLVNTQGQVLLIDLDAMLEHKTSQGAEKALNKDKQRFLKNWRDKALQKQFSSLLR